MHALLTSLEARLELLLALALAIQILRGRWILGERGCSPQHPDSQQHRATDVTHAPHALLLHVMGLFMLALSLSFKRLGAGELCTALPASITRLL
jgi:hypothetical protein